MSIPGAASPLFLATTGAADAFEISRSLRFNPGDSAYLSKTFASAGTRTTWTWSAWIKRSKTGFNCLFQGGNTSYNNDALVFNGDDKLQISFHNGSNGVAAQFKTTQVFRDFSAWYHIVLVSDTSNSASSDRLRLYVNGARVIDFDTNNQPGLNVVSHDINDAAPHFIGSFTGSGDWLNGYLAEVNFIDGQALDSSSFGEFDDNGVWQAKDTAGLTFGTNGFRLKFADNSGATATTLGKDSSGNSNNWTPNNLSVAAGANNDSLVDSPSNGTQTDTGAGGEVVGNYATFNPINSNTHSAYYTLSNGNLKCVAVGGSSQSGGSRGFCVSTIGMSSGKYYFELTVDLNDNNDHAVGIAKATGTGFYSTAGNWTYQAGGNKFANSGSGASYGASYTAGDTIGVAFNADTGALVCYKNGSSQGTLATVTVGETYFFVWGIDAGTAQDYEVSANFGQRAFAYPLSGYKSLNTANLPTPTIADGSKYFDTKVFTGDGSAKTVTGYQFEPDMIWLKNRSIDANHEIVDAIRGVNSMLFPNDTQAENTSTNRFTSFNSDGFTIGTGSNSAPNGNSNVGWAWDAGTSTVTNNDGSIASQVRANPSAGFSIVGFTGTGSNATVGHGLNAAPEFLIVKMRSSSGYDWCVYHSGLSSAAHVLDLARTNAEASEPATFNSTAPTSSVFSVGTRGSANNSGSTFIAYCFSSVAGYSAMGSYSANGSTDGVFVHLGFRPSWVLIKRTNATNYWIIQDSARNSHNVVDLKLAANASVAENDNATIGDASQNTLDFLSNGFKCRTSNAATNASGGEYIYLAFASNPFASNGGLAR